MDLASRHEISRTASFIRSRNFTRVGLQFPDELLKDSTLVARALRDELGRGVRLFVLADTAYGSCCVDEIAASHVDAECVVHYGHACMSPTSKLPALFVFGKAPIDVKDCAECVSKCVANSEKPVLVLYGLEYAHSMQDIKSAVADVLLGSSSNSVHYAEVACSIMHPSGDKTGKEHYQCHAGVDNTVKLFNNGDTKNLSVSDQLTRIESGTRFVLGGLRWSITAGQSVSNFLLLWIGSDDPAFANAVFTFNNCELVRYDAHEGKILNDLSPQKRILKRRYYLMEKAKDANVVGILVGTLGIAGYQNIIHQMKELIEDAGKKSYTLVMGRPNAAKLANFPECDVFVYVSCAQTALLDSKDFLAPVITPFEAVLAFSRGKQWTGEYMMEFRDLIDSTESKAVNKQAVNGTEEARFSFLQGGYVEDFQPQENRGGQKEISMELVDATEKALTLNSQSTDSVLFKGTARSGAEFFAARSYQGLNMEYQNPLPQSYIIGKTGRASGYEHETDELNNG